MQRNAPHGPGIEIEAGRTRSRGVEGRIDVIGPGLRRDDAVAGAGEVAKEAERQHCLAAARSRGGEDETGPYDVATGWPQPLGHPGWIWGSQGGVFAETPDRIYIANRGELPIPEKAPEGYTGGYGAFGQPATAGKPRMQNCILVVDGNGKLLEDWTQWDHLFEGGRGPHHIKINPYDPEKHVWVVDDMVQQVFEFTHDGKQLVMTLGERLKQGEDDKHFGRPEISLYRCDQAKLHGAG